MESRLFKILPAEPNRGRPGADEAYGIFNPIIHPPKKRKAANEKVEDKKESYRVRYQKRKQG